MAINMLLFLGRKCSGAGTLALTSTVLSVLYHQGNLLFIISPGSWAFLCEPGDGSLLSPEDLPLQSY